MGVLIGFAIGIVLTLVTLRKTHHHDWSNWQDGVDEQGPMGLFQFKRCSVCNKRTIRSASGF